LDGAITNLALGPSGILYATAAGSVFKFDGALVELGRSNLSSSIVELAYDAPRSMLYVLTAMGVFSYDASLALQCSVTDFVSAPSALSVGDTGVFVGTSDGTVRALTSCQNVGGSGVMMLDAWQYPAGGTLASSVTSITIDARDVDPIYVSTGDGTVHSLDYTGHLLWTYQRSSSGIHSIPTIDNRSGRLFYADDAGTPVILESDGSVAVSIQSQTSQGSAVESNLLVDEVRRQTASGMRLVRIYYFGASDGWIYKVESTR
jgi:hypothetical protein